VFQQQSESKNPDAIVYFGDTMEFKWNGSVLSYRQSGNGPQTMLLFHGFGQDASVFDELASLLGTRYSCYSFDLFSHGGSTRPHNDVSLTPKDWTDMMRAFFHAHNITRFSLLGYSIGARPVLALAGPFAAQIEHIFLIAPGGLTRDPWFSLATTTRAGRMLFRFLMERERPMRAVIRFVRATGLAGAKLLRFVSAQLHTREKRMQVFNTWIIYSKLALTSDAMDQLRKHGAGVLIIASKRDQVIPAKKIQQWLAQSGDNVTYRELDAPHHQLIPEITRNHEQWFTV